MIKSFKDFDCKLKDQKIYEAIDNDKNDTIDIHKKIETPNLLSDDDYFVKISRIVLKKLNKSGFGKFCIHPTIININDVYGVYFYKYDDPSMNIVICRNTFGKQAYFFKDFSLDGTSVANLVLTTDKIGFSKIIDELLSHISSNSIEEGINYEYVKINEDYAYTDSDVTNAAKFSVSVRQSIVDYIIKPKKLPKYNAFYKEVIEDYENGDPTAAEIIKEFTTVFAKKYTRTGIIKNVLQMFYDAVTGNTSQYSNINILLKGLNIDPNNQNNQTPPDPDDIDFEENIEAAITTYQRDPRIQKEIDKNIRKYKEDIDDIIVYTRSICRYVKKHGKLTNDERSVFKRGLIVTGSGGVGKTKHIEDVLEEEGMVKNVDYFELGSGNTSAQNLFKMLYDFNGKLVILDDSADMFEGKYNLPLWKLALDPDPRKNFITYNRSIVSSDKFYDPYKKDKTGSLPTRQQKYFLEVGKSSIEEKTKFKDKMKKELWARYSNKDLQGMDPDDLQNLTLEIDSRVDDAWLQYEEDKEPLIPITFKYNGAVIIISNSTREELVQKVTPAHWGAIKGRFKNVDINPMSQAIWETIKEKILEQRDTDPAKLLDEQCIIPRQYVDEFIEEVEKLIDFPMYNNMTWRMITDDMHNTFQGPTGISRWKRELRKQMNVKL